MYFPLRYHMMRSLINEGGCLSSLRRLPGAICHCFCCEHVKAESPVKAAPDLGRTKSTVISADLSRN